MNAITQVLRDEHQELLPHVQQLRAAADGISDRDLIGARLDVGESLAFLEHHLLPHAHAEEDALYPAVCRILGTPDATATMSRDHVEIARLTAELNALREELDSGYPGLAVLRELRRVLYGLYALVSVHFAKEEELYLPLLDAHLTSDQAGDLFRQMEEAASRAREHIHA